MKWFRIKAILIKEFGQLLRDKNMLAMILFAPILQLTLLGYAASLDIKNINTLLIDQDNSKSSRELIRKISYSGYFTIEHYSSDYSDIQKYLDNGKTSVAIFIPKNFENKILRNDKAKLQIIIDGTEGNSSAIAQSYIQQIISQYSFSLLNNKMSTIQSPQVTSEIRVWYNPALKSRNFIVPGVLVILLMISTMTLTSMAIVKEKEIGTLEQILVTPISPTELMIGKILPFIFVGFINVTIVLLIMNFVFGIIIKGSVVLLYAMTGIFLLNSLGLGLLISTISRTKQEAMMFSMFFVFQPMLNLSGFVFAIELMPKILQYISAIVPIRYYLSIIRGIILKGAGFFEILPNAIPLLFLGLFIIFLSINRFHKKI